MKTTKKSSLLWRITPADGTAPSYLFGTMHVRDLRAFGWLPLAEATLAECDCFATEFDFTETDPVALSAALALPEGKSLQDFLPAAPGNASSTLPKKNSVQQLKPFSISIL